jgi:hypothetical protein
MRPHYLTSDFIILPLMEVSVKSGEGQITWQDLSLFAPPHPTLIFHLHLTKSPASISVPLTHQALTERLPGDRT